MKQWSVVSATLHKPSSCKPADNSSPASTYLVTIAGSAGAFGPLCRVLEDLPTTLVAATVVMLHTGPGSILADVLYRRTHLLVSPARSGELLRSGRVYVATAGTHVIVNPDAVLAVSSAPRRRWFRPSADWLFESAAASYGPRHIAVVLSGMMSDGSAALRSVKRLGGTVLVQAPHDARYPEMPGAALSTGFVDQAVPIAAMAETICAFLAGRDATVDRATWERPFDVAEVA